MSPTGSNPPPRTISDGDKTPPWYKRIIVLGQYLGQADCPYMRRWVMNLGPLGSLRLHHWYRSDDKRARHDHPADFGTLVLRGSYNDVADKPHPDGELYTLIERMRPGNVAWRKAEHRHTVDVDPGGCWTLCYFRPDRRRWGFWTQRKDGSWKWVKANKWFFERGHHPCDQP